MKFHFIASENPEAKETLKVLIKKYDQTKLELSDVIIAIGGDGMLLKALRNSIEKNIIKLLEENNVAFDIGSYRSAPPGLRIWGGPTVDNDDIKKLLPWLDWAYHKSLRDLDI